MTESGSLGLMIVIGLVSAVLLGLGVLAFLAHLGMSSDIDTYGTVGKIGLVLIALGGIGFASLIWIFKG